MNDAADKIAKLFQLAENNPSQEQAAEALRKAHELMVKHNLTRASVEQAKGGKARRQEEMIRGGMYLWQRRLWKAVAELNFCLYWSSKQLVHERVRGRVGPRWIWHHDMVGRVDNIAAARHMAEYLQQAIERLVRERLGPDQRGMIFSRWAVSFREGAAEDIMRRVWDRNRELRAESEKRAEAARRAATDAQTEGQSSATALTLQVYIDQETDANIDFVYGEGTAAQWAAEEAEKARLEQMSEAEYTKWAAANPEEARERAASEKAAGRGGGGRVRERDWGAFYAGQEAGSKISIDPQVGSGNRRRLT